MEEYKIIEQILLCSVWTSQIIILFIAFYRNYKQEFKEQVKYNIHFFQFLGLCCFCVLIIDPRSYHNLISNHVRRLFILLMEFSFVMNIFIVQFFNKRSEVSIMNRDSSYQFEKRKNLLKFNEISLILFTIISIIIPFLELTNYKIFKYSSICYYCISIILYLWILILHIHRAFALIKSLNNNIRAMEARSIEFVKKAKKRILKFLLFSCSILLYLIGFRIYYTLLFIDNKNIPLFDNSHTTNSYSVNPRLIIDFLIPYLYLWYSWIPFSTIKKYKKTRDGRLSFGSRSGLQSLSLQKKLYL